LPEGEALWVQLSQPLEGVGASDTDASLRVPRPLQSTSTCVYLVADDAATADAWVDALALTHQVRM
jgi:hypothetical protein